MRLKLMSAVPQFLFLPVRIISFRHHYQAPASSSLSDLFRPHMALQRPAAVIEAPAAQQGRDEAEYGKGKTQAGAGQIVSLKRENPGAGQQPKHGINQQNGTGQCKDIQPGKGGQCPAVQGIPLSALFFPVRSALGLRERPFKLIHDVTLVVGSSVSLSYR
ncbi:hypothetical protein EKL85_21540 [Salmonella enterica subsp. enterica serovar Give]|nr:hypothetical protein [Salmonella enterica subsp. enterica serovar Give]ECA4141865.1 hypothetical protein [Salmonella enterica subsp. enterica serovar Give]